MWLLVLAALAVGIALGMVLGIVLWDESEDRRR